MQLSFERGDPQRPKGHALLYFRAWADSSAIYATYLIVPPISVEISKYIPPMFAGQFQQMGAGGISVFPYPPIPEKVENLGVLQHLAQARDEDLISGGSVDASSPERLLTASAEAAQQYFQQYSAYMEALPSGSQPVEVESGSGSVDVNEVIYGLMSERDRLAELAKLSGQLRYATGARDQSLSKDTIADANRLRKYLPEKYKVDDILGAAQRPGPEGDRLTQLYLDRAYRLADEDYEAVRKIEAEIQRLK